MLKKVKISKITIWLSLIVLLIVTHNMDRWGKGRVLEHDVLLYYYYVPATFIYGDLSLKFVDDDPAYFYKYFWGKKLDNGNRVNKMSMGMSFLYTPFFFIGHGAAHLLDYKTDGYSRPYQHALGLSSIFYLILGLFYLRRVLKRYFSEWIISFTIIAIVFATNLFHYATDQPAMTHVYSFALFSIFMYKTIQWHEKQKIGTAIVIGLLTGLISLIRPTNIIIILLFVFWNVYNLTSLKEKTRLFFKKYPHIIIIMLGSFLVWLPQIIYWKIITGSWLYYSYGDEPLYFNNSQIINGLFSYRNGWLLYTPIMIIAILGIPLLFRKIREFSWAIPLFFVINLYIVFSWWCWWYGGSFSIRALIESYAVLAIPFALCLKQITKINIVLPKILIFLLIGTLYAQGILFSIRYHYGSVHYDSMTKEAYWYSFFDIKPRSGFWPLLEKPDYFLSKQGVYEITWNKDILEQEKDKPIKSLEYYEEKIKSEPGLLNPVIEKAKKKNIYIYEMINLDAQWYRNQDSIKYYQNK